MKQYSFVQIDFYLFDVHEYFTCTNICAPLGFLVPRTVRNGSGSHGTRGIEVCNLPGECCEPQPDPHQEQQLFLIPVPAITLKINLVFRDMVSLIALAVLELAL